MNDSIRDTIDTFFTSYPRVNYPKGQILVFPGETLAKIYYLQSGRVCQYDISYRGDEIIVNTFKPPAFFPMAMAINDVPTKFFYRTETEASIHIAPSADVLKLIQQHPEVTYDLLSRVYTGIESTLERMVHLMSGTAKSRLIFELIIEFRRFGVRTGHSGYLEVTESSIAARSGLSRETVSREMKRLKEKGIVEIKSHKIYIDNVDKLEQLLGSHI